MIDVYLCLGSNLTNRKQNLLQATSFIKKHYTIKKKSSYYETEPIGYLKQNNFINQVILIETTDTASSVLTKILKIENTMGRVRLEKWGSRNIDIDILLYGREKINNPELVIPHKEMLSRKFMLEPLSEIAGSINIPGQKHNLSYFKEKVKFQKIKMIRG